MAFGLKTRNPYGPVCYCERKDCEPAMCCGLGLRAPDEDCECEQKCRNEEERALNHQWFCLAETWTPKNGMQRRRLIVAFRFIEASFMPEKVLRQKCLRYVSRRPLEAPSSPSRG